MSALHPMTLLLVEDDPAHAEITFRNLAEFAHHVRDMVHVTDGQAALDYLDARAAEQLPHIVLLDLRLPRVDGLEVLRRIKQNSQWRRIPIVVLTTSEADRDVFEAYDRGANGYLVKPVDYQSFVSLMRSFGSYWLTANLPSHA